MENQKQPIIISSKSFASSIKFMIGISYKEIPHHKLKGKNVFAFEDTQLVRDTIDGLMELRKKLNK